jgi:hypothetical protein
MLRPSSALSLRSTLPRLVAAAVLAACGGGSAPDTDRTASASQAIEGGHLINDSADEVSRRFPRSTVMVLLNGGSGSGEGCTGTLIAAKRVLTAAHCVVGSDNVLSDDLKVTFYDPGFGNGAAPDKSTAQVVPHASVDLPLSVSCSRASGVLDPACYSNGVLADIAVLTLPTDVTIAPSPYQPAYLAPKGAVAALIAAKRARASWAVGVGYMNFASPHCAGVPLPTPVSNFDSLMEWVPVASFSNAGANGVFSNTGILTNSAYIDPGDSGGPLYQYAGIKDSLALLGVASSSQWCDASVSRYTDVTEPSNYDWLVSEGATEMPTTGSFGAGL